MAFSFAYVEYLMTGSKGDNELEQNDLIGDSLLVGIERHKKASVFFLLHTSNFRRAAFNFQRAQKADVSECGPSDPVMHRSLQGR